MTAAFTKGPWACELHPDNADEKAKGRESWSCVYIGEESDYPPGRVWRTFIEGNITHGPEQGDPEADLRLIAAAPSLFEALKELVAGEEREDIDAIMAALPRARAALSAAEGETP